MVIDKDVIFYGYHVDDALNIVAMFPRLIRMSESIVFVSGARTPFGSFQGALAGMTAAKLGAHALSGAIHKSKLAPTDIDTVLMGTVLQAGQGQAPARQAALAAGLSQSTTAVTINKVCGSGTQSILDAARLLMVGDAQVVAAGGMEAMSQTPFYSTSLRAGAKMGHQTLLDGLIHDGLWDPYNQQHMGNCAELCAREHQFSRQAQDEYAVMSFERALAAQKAGFFTSEIHPLTVTLGKSDSQTWALDEGPAKVKFDKIPTLRPAFQKDGSVTAANASTINDGAAAVILTTARHAQAKGLKPQAKLISMAGHAQDPLWFTTAPVTAMQRALSKAGWTVKDVDLFEVNEAFAVVALAAEKELSIPRAKLNINGGAIAIGHPIGASGTRIVWTLIESLKQKGLRKGCASICIGGGEALAVCVEII